MQKEEEEEEEEEEGEQAVEGVAAEDEGHHALIGLPEQLDEAYLAGWEKQATKEIQSGALYKKLVDRLFTLIRSAFHAEDQSALVQELGEWENYLKTSDVLVQASKSNKLSLIMKTLRIRLMENPTISSSKQKLDDIKEDALELKKKASGYYEESLAYAKTLHQSDHGQKIHEKVHDTFLRVVMHIKFASILTNIRQKFISYENQDRADGKMNLQQRWVYVLDNVLESIQDQDYTSKTSASIMAQQIVLWFYGLELEENTLSSQETEADQQSNINNPSNSSTPAVVSGTSEALIRSNVKRLGKYIETVQERTKFKNNEALEGLTYLVPKLEEWMEHAVKRVSEMKSKGRFEELTKTMLEHITDDRCAYFERKIDECDPQSIVDYAELVAWNSKERKKFVEKLKDDIIRLLLEYLPNIPVPPLTGEKDGVDYNVKGLDLSGFSFKKENITIKLASIEQIKSGEPFVTIIVDDIVANMKKLEFKFQQNYFPFIQAEGNADAKVLNASFIIGLQVFRGIPHPDDDAETDSGLAEDGPVRAGSSMSAAATATAVPPLVSIDKLSSSANQNPNKRRAPGPNTNKELKVSEVSDPNDGDEIPQFSVGVVRVGIEKIDLNIHGTNMSWLYNGVSDVFSHNIRSYVISLIQDGVEEQLVKVTDTLNLELSSRWKIIKSSLEMDMSLLPDEERATARAAQFENGFSKRKDVYSVTFTGHGPLGIALIQEKEYVLVQGFRRANPHVPLPGERSGKIKPRDVLVGYNGQDIESLPLDRVMARLKRSPRPLTLSFVPGTSLTQDGELKPSSSSSSKSSKTGLSKLKSRFRIKSSSANAATNGGVAVVEDSPITKVVFKDPKLYMLIKPRASSPFSAIVTGFRLTEKGDKGPAEKSGKIQPGFVLTRIQGTSTKKLTFQETFDLFAAAPRPIELEFMLECDFDVVFSKELPTDLRFGAFPAKGETVPSMLVITGFKHIPGPAEVQCGDRLESGFFVKSIAGVSTDDMPFDTIISTLRDSQRPVDVDFAAPTVVMSSATDLFSAPTPKSDCSATFQDGPLGIIFYRRTEDNRCCFKAFVEFPGPAKRTNRIRAGDVLVAINGTPVPCDEKAVEEMIMNASLPITLKIRDMEQFELLSNDD